MKTQYCVNPECHKPFTPLHKAHIWCDEACQYGVLKREIGVKERTEHLEPARVRDLKMTVVTIAQF